MGAAADGGTVAAMGLIARVLAASLTLLPLLIAAPAQAALAPVGALVFCQSHAAQCRPAVPAQIGADAATLALLQAVNARINDAIRPRLDDKEIWSLNPAAGDCEDYALSKRAALIRGGVPAGALHIAIGTVNDEQHAVLLIDTVGGLLVLDNLTDAIRPLNRSHFRLSGMSQDGLLNWSYR